MRWLHLLSTLGLGACLADDMGLGKTIQVLALLLVLRAPSASGRRRPSLLVAPASLLANWASEIERFAPSLKALVAHPSAMPAAELQALEPGRLADVDLVITSYGSLLRLPWLAEDRRGVWRSSTRRRPSRIPAPSRRAPSSSSTRRRGSRSPARRSRTGSATCGRSSISSTRACSARARSSRASPSASRDRPHNPYGPLRELVRPYILRRLKTDKTVIADLPDKTEVKAFCQLSRKQAALYQQAVKELAAAARADAEGIQRRGLVLAFLMRFKQICNHPSQWLGDGAWSRSRQRQVRAPARDRRGDRRQAGEGARLHPVPRGDRAARGVPRRRCSAGPGSCCTARPR